MKKNLVIIGAGPRGLAVALRAIKEDNLKVYIIDNAPLSTWQFPNMLPNIHMRSPISFDLTTYFEDLKEFSLPTFLNEDIKVYNHRDVEDVDIYCARKDFIKYLNHICLVLKQKGVIFIKRNVCNISTTKLTCPDGFELHYDFLVMATGKNSNKDNCPNYLRGKKCETIQSIHDCSWKDKVINVIGSGQQSAELVEFLASQKAKVFWVQKHKPKVTQYPVPSMKQWGLATALGDYYYQVEKNKPAYLQRVKQWGPSITPYIADRLSRVKYTILNNPSSTNDLDMNAKFILAAGSRPKVELLNIDFDIKRNIHDACLPDIIKGFRSSSHPNIFFTGLLALRYDGPRQGSIISSAITAHNIIKCIRYA